MVSAAVRTISTIPNWIVLSNESQLLVARRLGINFTVVPRVPNKQDAMAWAA
jgi:hypothetical protein